MKVDALRKLRATLAADKTAIGLWITLESPSITEMAVALGFDWVVIDAEHGHLDWKEILEHIRATVRSETVVLVRVAELNGGLIKRVLDIGADGVVVPWVESAEQLRQAIAWAQYPPEGRRGIGGDRATCWGQCLPEHTAEANENVLVVPIIETVATMRQVPQMCQVPGAELFLFGPADYSSTAGYRGQWEGPGVADQIQQMKDQIRRAGKNCGLLATDHQNLLERQQQGFRFVGVGQDVGLMAKSLRAALEVAGRDRPIQASLETAAPSVKPPLARPPESFRPDRPEVITRLGQGQKVEIARGVEFECLVGKFNNAKKLTTGIVTMQPGAMLPYHSHIFTESVTLLSGTVIFEVEGRSYHLDRLDNVVIPAGIAHCAKNGSSTEPAKLQIAMGTDNPTRTLVEKFFTRRAMPQDSTGLPGAERVNRFATAPRSAAGPNTEFIDHFNVTLMPGLDLSGGYGLFHPTGRLPAHIHDFDESICIISGTATCVVEGRKYSLANCDTALEPRGRVHYFINDTQETMEMLWVYAGPKPERIIVDERNGTVEGNPWK
ncbi:MAG: aldolase/citrate lyase family protein [Planctomycetales bacterium]